MKKVFWFFNENEAYYSDQCVKALAENRIMEYPQEEDAELLNGMRYYKVISEREWESLVYSANAQQMDIVNNPETNLPMLRERPSIDPHSKEALEAERMECKQWFREMGGHDDMAIKCSVLGLDFKTKYPDLYNEGVAKRARINEIEAELASLE